MGNCVLCIICNLVACFVLQSHHVSGNTNGSEPLCLLSIKVPRNKLNTASVNTLFKINCNVTIVKCEGIPRITWCKIYGNNCKAINQSNYIETMWKNITQHDGILFLTFLNITMEDAGLYRCKGQNSVSQSINVTVTGNNKDNGTAHNKNNTTNDMTNSTFQHVDNPVGFWYYVNICRWTAGLTVILTGVFLIIIRFKTKKNNKENEDMITTAINPSSLLLNADNPHSNISPSVSSSSDGIYVNTEDL